MRACSGTWIAHGSGNADRDTVDRHDRVDGAARAARLPLRRVWLIDGGGAGLLLRLRQRGPVAAVPHRAHAADVPRVRLGALPQRQPALRRRRRRRGAHRRPDRPGAGLSLRAAAAHDPRAPAARDHHHVLAHPLAEPRGVRHLPVARGDARGPARQHRSSASTRSSTATTSSTPSTASSRRASTARPSPSPTAASRTEVRRYPISIEWPPAALQRPAAGRRVPQARARAARPVAGRAARRRRRPPRLHQGHPRALHARSSGCSSSSRAGSAGSRSSSSRRRRARRSTIPELRGSACARSPRASTSASAAPGYQPIILQSSTTTRRRCSSYYRAADALLRHAACTTA